MNMQNKQSFSRLANLKYILPILLLIACNKDHIFSEQFASVEEFQNYFAHTQEWNATIFLDTFKVNIEYEPTGRQLFKAIQKNEGTLENLDLASIQPAQVFKLSVSYIAQDGETVDTGELIQAMDLPFLENILYEHAYLVSEDSSKQFPLNIHIQRNFSLTDRQEILVVFEEIDSPKLIRRPVSLHVDKFFGGESLIKDLNLVEGFKLDREIRIQ